MEGFRRPSFRTFKKAFSNKAQELYEAIGPTPAKSLKAALLSGDETKALNVYMQQQKNGKSLLEDMHPSLAFPGRNEGQDTPMHLACLSALKLILQQFLDRGGSPNVPNARNQTALHCVCQRADQPQERLDCLEALLAWRGLEIDGESETVLINSVDNDGNTALHYAAMNGLQACVEKLIGLGAYLSIVNKDQFTTCDVADNAGHLLLANTLESAMVLDHRSDAVGLSQLDSSRTQLLGMNDSPPYTKDVSSFDRSGTLKWLEELIDMASNTLNISKEHAEALLEVYDWNFITLSEEFEREPESVCSKAKLQLSSVLAQQGGDNASTGQNVCTICGDPMTCVALKPTPDLASDSPDKHGAQLGCGHGFCIECISTNTRLKVSEGGSSLDCPGYQCGERFPVDWTAILLPTTDDQERFAGNRVRSLVDRCTLFSWCPHAECGLALKLAQSEAPPQTDEGVNILCEKGHGRCARCNSDVHAPATCSSWNTWQEQVRAEVSRAGESKDDPASIADLLWINANTKQCPKCHTHIEKNDGCNHMTCRKCRHEFCWICMSDWSLHDTSTGGYFMCNRFQEQAADEDDNHDEDGKPRSVLDAADSLRPEEAGSAQADSRRARERADKVARFIHHYTRTHTHTQSHDMEMKMRESTLRRFDNLFGSQDDAIGVLQQGFDELAKCRVFLRGSYVYAYFEFSSDSVKQRARTAAMSRRMEKSRTEERRRVFESFQSDLERRVETLSDVVARKRLRASKSHIQVATINARNQRLEFEHAVRNGLVPEETLAFQFSHLSQGRHSRRNSADRNRHNHIHERTRLHSLFDQHENIDEASLPELLASLSEYARLNPSRNLGQPQQLRQYPQHSHQQRQPNSQNDGAREHSFNHVDPEDIMLLGFAGDEAAREEEALINAAILQSFQDNTAFEPEQAAPDPPAEAVEALMSMGFDRNSSLQALRRAGNNVEAAANALLLA